MLSSYLFRTQPATWISSLTQTPMLQCFISIDSWNWLKTPRMNFRCSAQHLPLSLEQLQNNLLKHKTMFSLPHALEPTFGVGAAGVW